MLHPEVALARTSEVPGAEVQWPPGLGDGGMSGSTNAKNIYKETSSMVEREVYPCKTTAGPAQWSAQGLHCEVTEARF